jgi:hypothetical protein
MKTPGTKDWAQHNVNCCFGCSHGCLYCYAREIALRYKRIASGADWTRERCNAAGAIADETKYGARHKGVVMFPTAHDITAGNINEATIVLLSLLEAGNHVLLVTKPSLVIMTRVADLWMGVLVAWQHAHPSLGIKLGAPAFDGGLEVRCTITCLDERERRFWEPGAPKIVERIEALRLAYNRGLLTSVSIEPCLQPDRVARLVEIVTPYVRGTIWIGKCNDLRRRTAWRREELAVRCIERHDGTMPVGAFADPDKFDEMLAALEAQQTDAAVMDVYRRLKDNPKVRWKDSYAEVIARCGGK